MSQRYWDTGSVMMQSIYDGVWSLCDLTWNTNRNQRRTSTSISQDDRRGPCLTTNRPSCRPSLAEWRSDTPHTWFSNLLSVNASTH